MQYSSVVYIPFLHTTRQLFCSRPIWGEVTVTFFFATRNSYCKRVPPEITRRHIASKYLPILIRMQQTVFGKLRPAKSATQSAI